MKMFTAALLLTLAGCASLGKLVTPNSVLISQIGFDVAVGAACGPDTVAGRAKALAIKTIASELLAVDTGSSVPLSLLQATLQTKIAALSAANPGEALAANEVLVIVSQIVANLTTPSAGAKPVAASTATVAIATVLQQIISATGAYGV